ncbi:hypothetical protein D1B33_01880 [Lysinibacillus yapensis]|uniref:Uncharacterized protein n=1 Tax=Ureibacillus yapensis TaxID=2304605 RepID=A0A396ST28_9BACL|nr:hypothetical protein [Lysinibacillus yapensis]RHW39621.1 hypothetical protein D1B33_01880 [Lysinibacillus yapensis]
MFGSIFYNLWGALLGFTIYFLSTLSASAIPLNSILGSLIAGAVSFLLMYPIRFLIGYCLYTPDDQLFQNLDEENEMLRNNAVSGQTESAQRSSTVEFSDENAEEIAKVVQSMMNQEIR